MQSNIIFQKYNWNPKEKTLLKKLDVWSKIVEEMVNAKHFACSYTGLDIILIDSFMWRTSIYGYDFWCDIDNKLDELKGE